MGRKKGRSGSLTPLDENVMHAAPQPSGARQPATPTAFLQYTTTTVTINTTLTFTTITTTTTAT